MKGRSLLGILALASAFILPFSSAAASSQQPTFPSCSNPQGSISASYDSGSHGIAGDQNQYAGGDKVYSLDNGNAMQCFCGGNKGIQTNWWKVGLLSQEQIQSLENQGWIYIPDGSSWGLSDSAYMAYNTYGSCGQGTQPTPTNQPSTNNPGSGNSGGSGGTGGSNGPTTCNDTAPSYPPYLTSVVSGPNSVTLTWSKAGDPVDHYFISYGTQSGVYIFGAANVGNVTTYTVYGLSSGETYYFIVNAVNGCRASSNSNEVYNSIPRGLISGSGNGPTEGLIGGVLGTATDLTTTSSDTSSLTKNICAQCFWWPILLGEVIALVALYLLLKNRSLRINKYILGGIIGLVAYLIFLLFNKGHICPDGGIGFWKLNIPCHYFWALDGVMVLLFSWVIRGIPVPDAKKPSKRK